MKFIRIFLLVLIIVGIVALATQKIWVPKLVNKILSSEEITVLPPITQPNVTLTDGRQCYVYSHDATPLAPYTVNEFLDITIKGTNVTGNKTGTEKGPDMDTGYGGSITGTLDKNTITDVYSYIIEQSHNKEKEIYQANKTGIEKLRYPLVDEKGILVPDLTKPYQALPYARVECTGSN
jgi:hypothetical protein